MTTPASTKQAHNLLDNTPELELAHVTLIYEGGIRALDNISLSVYKGERICVLGANGSGKSTLAGVVCGLLAPDAGDVLLAGETVCKDGTPNYEAYRRARRSMGLVFQNPDDQIVTSVVEEDVAFGPENLALPTKEIARRVARELHRVALEDFARADPTKLSGGQKQRVTIAGALAMEPSTLVLDEPGALLDVRGRRSIMYVMDRLQAAGTTIVHITHFMEDALAADRLIVLDHGCLALAGTPDEVFAHEQQIRALGLEEPFAARLAGHLHALKVPIGWTCNEDALKNNITELAGISPKTDFASTPPTSESRTDHAASTATTATADSRYPSSGPPKSTLAIDARNVSYSYHDTNTRAGCRLALDAISLEIPLGSSCALIGQTGSGKSTLLRLICALEAPDAGQIIVGGTDTSTKRNRRRLLGRIGYVMQHPERQLFAETVWADVSFGPKNLHLPPDEIRDRTQHALEFVGLSDRAHKSPFELSGGQKRLCAIAGVLAMHPVALVLDEPMAGLDPSGRAQMTRLLHDLTDKGITLLAVTHSMDDAARFAQVVVLNQSHVMMAGTPADIFSDAHRLQLSQAGLGLPRALRWALDLQHKGMQGLGAPLTIEALAGVLAQRLTSTTTPTVVATSDE